MTVAENRDPTLQLMDVIQQPMFLLDVEGPEAFVFRGLNKIHQTKTGLNADDILGQRPHDIFPARLADTIVQNYEVCRASGHSHTYEEILELPNGACWWQTTLSAIHDENGDVSAIIGVAFDITKSKDAAFTASSQLAKMTRLNEDLQVFAATTASDMRGPFQTMIALLDMVMEGFVDLGDEKGDQLALCSEIAQDAIHSMTGILATAQGLQVPSDAIEEVDLGHLASDIAALLDPHQRLNIDLPRVKISTDRVALQMVLRNVMENAVAYADKNIAISVSENGQDQIVVTISDDGVGMSGDKRSDGLPVLPTPGQDGARFGLSSAQGVVVARGGEMLRAQNAFLNGAAIRFALPGSIVGGQAKQNPAPQRPAAAVADYQRITSLPFDGSRLS